MSGTCKRINHSLTHSFTQQIIVKGLLCVRNRIGPYPGHTAQNEADTISPVMEFTVLLNGIF